MITGRIIGHWDLDQNLGLIHSNGCNVNRMGHLTFTINTRAITIRHSRQTIIAILHAGALRAGLHGFARLYGSWQSADAMALLWIMLRFNLKTLQESKIILSLYKISVAGVFMAIIIQIIKTPLANSVDMTKFWGIFTQGATAGVIGLLVYWFICWILGLEEMQDFLASAKRRWLNLQNVPREVEENK